MLQQHASLLVFLIQSCRNTPHCCFIELAAKVGGAIRSDQIISLQPCIQHAITRFSGERVCAVKVPELFAYLIEIDVVELLQGRAKVVGKCASDGKAAIHKHKRSIPGIPSPPLGYCH